MTFEIIKNAEVPKGRRSAYPFAQMEVGDGFDAPRDLGTGKNGADKRQNTVSSAARTWARKHSPAAQFTVRLLNETTVRCVRIA